MSLLITIFIITLSAPPARAKGLFPDNLLFAQQTREKGAKETNYLPDEILVKFKANVPGETIEEINVELEVEVIEEGPLANFYRLRIPPGSTVKEMLKKYRALPQVKYAEPNYIMRIR